jgi:hypothetical protein
MLGEHAENRNFNDYIQMVQYGLSIVRVEHLKDLGGYVLLTKTDPSSDIRCYPYR